VGGIRTFIRYVYRNLDPKQWEFAIVAPDCDELRIMMNDLADLDPDLVPVGGMPEDGSSAFWRMFRCVTAQLAKKNYDLVHSHGFTSGISAAIPALMWRTPHLMTSHDVINEGQFEGTKGKLKKGIMGSLFGLIDTIQSVSYDAQNNFMGYFPGLGRRKDKCVVIPNGIEVERFELASPRDLRAELGVGEDVFLIGFLGRFMSQKGFRYLVDAIDLLCQDANLPKAILVLSFGGGGFIREEMAAIEERRLEKYFRFMPFAPDAAGTIKGLDAIAMPSLWEACPLQPMEALVCGTPFIGSDCLGLREVLQHTPARIIPSGDSEALAKAIMDEILYPSKEEALAFREQAAARFNVKQRVEEIEMLMMKCINGKKGKLI
jgi:glycosyltransferase involved in cell wall biosynthesis